MELKKLIRSGFFLKELPPPFNTNSFADLIDDIVDEWNNTFNSKTTKLSTESGSEFKRRRNDFITKYSSSREVEYSISKGKLARRMLKIPNPKHFTALSKEIIDNWTDIEDHFKKSNFSKSYPIEENDINKRAVKTYSKSVSDFIDTILDTSFNRLYEIRVDISKFYPSIYTHTIPWALIGKQKAKFYFNNKSDYETDYSTGVQDAILYEKGNKLDTLTRSCQDRQSIGISIGPDTSHIISEIVACRIDLVMQTKFPEIKACRYYDDYYLYANSYDEAEKILKILQKTLNDYQLEINESKVKINKYPFYFENEWVTKLQQFQFKKTNITNSLKHYFSIIWDLASKKPNKSDWILKYALKIFEFRQVEINKNSWKTFENLLLKTILVEPSILDIATRLFITYQSFIDTNSKERISDIIKQVITNHSPIKHNFETSWSLWLLKTLEIKLDNELAEIIFTMEDNISTLILLDMEDSGLINGTINKSNLESELTGDILFSEKWLMAYEAVKKGWLTPLNPNLISDNEYFKILSNKNIEFYDRDKQLSTYNKQDKQSDTTDILKYIDKIQTQNENTEDETQDNVPDFPSNIF